MGPVFRTQDQDRDRLVAVKAFTLDLTPEQAANLAAEFQRLVDLEIDQSCIAAPLATGVEEFVAYLASPYVAGESLDAAIRQYGPAPAGDAMRLVAHVAEALDAAAQVGVFHGSLHPRDIIVTPGETHITGLGVAQALERIGLHGPVRRPYVSPEREGGDEWGAAADIYSLAAIAYEVLTGRRALPGTDQPLPALNDLRVHDAAALKELIEAAFDPDPERRPAHAREFAQALAAALSEAAGPPAAADRGAGHRPRKPRTRPPKLPGIDEPLLPAGAPASAGKAKSDTPPRVLASLAPLSARARVVTPAVAPKASVPPASPAGEEAAVEAGPAPVAGAPADVPIASAGETAEVQAVSPPQPPSGETAIEFPIATGTLTPDLTPELRLPVELEPKADDAHARADADLAAALDRLSDIGGGRPSSSEIGIDIVGPEPVSSHGQEDAASPDISFGTAAETQREFELPADLGEIGLPDTHAAGAASTPTDENLALDLVGGDRITPAASARDEAEIDLGTFDLSFPQEEHGPAAPTPTVEGPEAVAASNRPLERRRAAFRLTPAEGRLSGSAPVRAVESEMPRAFEETRSTPSARSVPGFEFLGGERPSRPTVFPVVIGVAAGLVLGLAVGYWLGSRSAAPGPQASRAPSASSSSAGTPAGAGVRPAFQPAVVPPPAAPATAAGPGGASVVSPPASPAPGRAAAVGPSAAAPAAATPPAVGERPPDPARSAANVRGSIDVTAKPKSANVYLDGERNGLTPRNLHKVPLGSHTIRVTRPGYEPQEQTVVLTAEQPSARLEFTLKPSAAAAAGAPAPKAAAGGPQPKPAVKSVLTVLIESMPAGARIRIDGRALGATPLLVRQLRPGTHKIELTLTGYRPWSSSITVAVGDHQRISAPLVRDNTR